MIVFKRFSFDAAHRLPCLGEDHKCNRIHGHTFHLEMRCASEVDPETGMVVAYEDITAEHGLGKFTKFMIRAAQVATSRQERFQWKHFVEVVGASTLMREMPKS